ncbi:MAG TPA: nitrite/sulfite reductase [Candidatus Nanopelagicales bacterium]|nr:nitrite/sulfite reductase [Candidatus Nanopelagicales bacterium]
MPTRTERLQGAIDRFADNVTRFQRGEISPDEFRPLRLGMGLYAQLAHVKHMQRIKIPGGRITSEQLEAMADVTDRWARGLAHVTTRQDVQIHHLELDDAVELNQVLLKCGISNIGACADAVRNVTASHLAGVVEDEVFDVTPYAFAITEHFYFHEHNLRLPRKFKVGLSGSPRDHAQIMINDLGLLAKIGDEGPGFAVYVAGGLGSTPEIAHLWLDYIPVRDVLAASEAVVAVFFRDGERKNRKKARIKFLLRKIGEAEFLRRLDEEFARIKADRADRLAADLDRYLAEYVDSEPPPPQPGGDALGDAAFARWKRTNTIAQKQPGYRVATVKLPLGDITGTQLRHLAALCREFADGEVRATNTQNLVLRWVPEGHLVALHRALGLLGLAEPDADHITDVVSCPGGDYCTLAVTQSMKVAARVRDHLVPQGNRQEAEDAIRDIGPFSIKISGCPNSCGQHHVADIGMTGVLTKGTDGVERQAYSFRLGGGCGPSARVGDRMDGRILEEEAPRVIAAIARFYASERAPGESFQEFVQRKGVQEITKIGFAAAGTVI